MGKKQKIGKQRQDKFYHLAKETGYRSRAAFKLIQLNRKFEFLQRCRVLVDLCAAPGGWLQVAAQNMPVSSLIIGVDLVPIKPLPNVMTLEEDITSDKCKQALKKHLKTWKADVVLNDGAPNVGKNWLHDAFQQAQLTIQALKLATNFLAKGGWFVTKVFRSKDYHALMWVFKQFFKKVYATKPQASRSESAEIFVVCENYLAPDKIDPKLLDVKCVFEEVESEPKAKLNLMFPEKEKRRVEGYPEGATTLHRRVDVSRFVTSSSFVELLNDCNELVFDEEKYEKSKSTTDEIKECCKDIKVLGRKELRLLLTWRKKLHEEFHEVDRVKSDVKAKESSPDEDLRIQHLVEEAQLEELQELKRKKKKVLKERRKLHEKMNLKMILPNDEAVVSEDKSLFYLETIKNKKDLAEVDKGSSKIIEEEEEEDVTKMLSKKKTVSYDKEKIVWDDVDSDDDVHDESDDEISINSIDTNSDDDEREESTKIGDDGEKNPLLVDLDDDPHRLQKKKKTKLWFEKDIFSGLEKKSDETYEIDQMTEYFKNKSESRNKSESNPLTVSSHLSVDSNVEKGEEKVEDEKNELHSKSGKKRRQTLDVEGLALGTLMIHSRKKRRDVVDDSWNRYTYADENLPSWFVTDEEKHNKKQLPVSKEMVEEFKQKLKEINARPIKKIAEAKARKKRKMLKKMEKARKKAEAVTDSTDMSEVEKRHRVKAIYKKLMPNKKEEVTYVVAKKGAIGKRARRPAGVKGRFKVVDPRMKKDPSRSQKQEKTRKRK